ncbi:MAG TPA: class I SAM-dependent methyltransferase [Gemmatimonadales bacterium]
MVPQAHGEGGRIGQDVAASFRDPAGRLLAVDGRILRLVHRGGAGDLAAFLASSAAQQLIVAGRVVATRTLDRGERAALRADPRIGAAADDAAQILEHQPIPFPSYPYEWPAEMLLDAGRLTLDLAERLLAEGLGLKDATPYNVLFDGPRARFVDVLSVERRDPLDATWLPYAQFVRTFVLPLLVNRHFHLPLRQVFEASRDGLEPEAVYRLCGPLQRLRPPFLTLASLPTWLAARHRSAESQAATYRPKRARSPEEARFVLRYQFRRLRRSLEAAAPRGGRVSPWSDYATADARRPELAAKTALVEQLMHDVRPHSVLDVGCNTGYLAMLAARAGARVVAIDADPVVVGAAWRSAAADGWDVLPLVVDLTRPSPAIGWRNRECPAFLERAGAGGGFDAVWLFAVIHHMLVTERVPLTEIIDLAADLTTPAGHAVIEFIPPDDPLFRRLTRGREALFADLTAPAFEAAAKRRFVVLGSQPVPGTGRRLYLLRKTP